MNLGQSRGESVSTRMSASVERDGGVAVLVVSGEVDMATAPLVTAQLHRCLAERPATLVLDLTAVSFFGSSGLHMLAAAERHTPQIQTQGAIARQTTVRIAASSAVLQVLEIAGLASLLEVYPSRADALADIAPRGESG